MADRALFQMLWSPSSNTMLTTPLGNVDAVPSITSTACTSRVNAFPAVPMACTWKSVNPLVVLGTPVELMEYAPDAEFSEDQPNVSVSHSPLDPSCEVPEISHSRHLKLLASELVPTKKL